MERKTGNQSIGAMILAHHQITTRIHSRGNHNSSTPRFRCTRESRYLPEATVTDGHESHSGELCDEEPIVALCRLLEAALPIVGQLDLAPWRLTKAAPLASLSSISMISVGDLTHPQG
jgi:hypothetical protein